MRKKTRITIEYSGKVEHCGSREIAITRFEELTKEKPYTLHVLIRINGKVVAECIPLVIDGVAVEL